MKIYQETTHWSDSNTRLPNHVYLMDGDRAFAYSKWGEADPQYFSKPLRLDKRGRKFVEIKKNLWGFDLSISASAAQTPGKTWQVTGSKGDVYTVSLNEGQWACTCTGFTFRGKCKHLQQKQAA